MLTVILLAVKKTLQKGYIIDMESRYLELSKLSEEKQRIATIGVVRRERKHEGHSLADSVQLVREFTNIHGEIDFQGINDYFNPIKEQRVIFQKEMPVPDSVSFAPGWQRLVVMCRLDENLEIAETRGYSIHFGMPMA